MHGKRIVSEKCAVTSSRKIQGTEGTYLLKIKNRFIASNYKPGQFVMIKPNPGNLNPLLARPFSIFNKSGDSEFEVLYRVLGSSTEILSKVTEDALIDVSGPLGNGFDFSGRAEDNAGRTHILIAGGIGVAPLYSIPDYLKAGGDKVILYYGAAKESELYFRRDIGSGFDGVYFATDDGSFGHKGSVLDLLERDMASYVNGGVYFYSCGPRHMLNALASRFLAAGIPDRLQLSLEESFGCGIGVCLGCVVKIKKGNGQDTCRCHDPAVGFEPPEPEGACGDYEYKRVCKDGPVFYADKIFDYDFKDAISSASTRAVKSGSVNIEAGRNPGIAAATAGNSNTASEDVNLSVKLGGLVLDYPVMPASGTFGYGEEFIDIVDYKYFGALVTKGISLEPSRGNEMPRICEVSCGMINSIGLQNVGFEKFRDEKMPFVRETGKPVIVNFFGKTIGEYAALAKKLSEVGGIAALEANISCPNIEEGGRSFGADPETVYELVSSVKEAVGKELPVIVKLTPMVSDISLIAEICEKAGADILSLINTIPAAKIDIKTRKFKLSRGSGGLSGAAVKPVAIKLVRDVYNSVRIPIIGMGGISSWEDAVEFFLAGASAVSVGTYSFVQPKIIPEIAAGLKGYLTDNGFDSIYQIIGLAKI